MNKRKKSLNRNHILLFGFLFGFWLVLSPRISVESISIGLLASFMVTYFSKSYITDEGELSFFSVGNVKNVITYILRLLLEIVKSNIDVAKIVLSPTMPISPQFVRVPVKPQKDFYKVLYGNSITLTPGTLTVDIVDGEYIVHALTDGAAEDLKNSIIEKHILSIEGGRQ
ncbi:MAG: Na+/H+ antiporter subunit E [Eubacteriales bacterium]|nr:Na+/H+ antiporter subunit E [Eubacteriales bacterium]